MEVGRWGEGMGEGERVEVLGAEGTWLAMAPALAFAAVAAATPAPVAVAAVVGVAAVVAAVAAAVGGIGGRAARPTALLAAGGAGPPPAAPGPALPGNTWVPETPAFTALAPEAAAVGLVAALPAPLPAAAAAAAVETRLGFTTPPLPAPLVFLSVPQPGHAGRVAAPHLRRRRLARQPLRRHHLLLVHGAGHCRGSGSDRTLSGDALSQVTHSLR